MPLSYLRRLFNTRTGETREFGPGSGIPVDKAPSLYPWIEPLDVKWPSANADPATIPSPDIRPIMDIARERCRQDIKWGEQNHDDLTWLAILMEEVGELATEINDKEPGEKRYAELTQIAAVAVAWLECMRRRDASA